MAIDLDKIDDTVLGLSWLTLRDENHAWKALIGALRIVFIA